MTDTQMVLRWWLCAWWGWHGSTDAGVDPRPWWPLPGEHWEQERRPR